MTAQPFRRSSPAVEAIRLDHDNAKDVCDWVHSHAMRNDLAEHPRIADDGAVNIVRSESVDIALRPGDWLVRDDGELLVCDPHAFRVLYEPAPTRVPPDALGSPLPWSTEWYGGNVPGRSDLGATGIVDADGKPVATLDDEAAMAAYIVDLVNQTGPQT